MVVMVTIHWFWVTQVTTALRLVQAMTQLQVELAQTISAAVMALTDLLLAQQLMLLTQ